MESKDIRWEQRFSNFDKALQKLEEAVKRIKKDFLVNAGNNSIFGSKDATREAFASGLIQNGELWMDMIKSRNKTSHTYIEETADEIFLKIMNDYINEFILFRKKMEEFQNKFNN